MIRRITLGIALAMACIPLTAGSQSTDNPHGDIKNACGSCHTANGWKSIAISPTFEHAPRTFPLEGAHARASCGSCHRSLDFSKASTSCASCHQDVHKGELGVTCGSCHSTRSFVDRVSMQRAHESTRFPLRGAHLGADCLACHTMAPAGRGQFVNTPTQCVSCHSADYRTATVPNHAEAGFSTACGSCHSSVAWLGATFKHNATAFPLTGSHLAVACTGCHVNGVYRGVPTACVACHLTDYNNTATPRHSSVGFSTDCTACHTTARWLGATFNHDGPFFPIYSGKHKGKWTTCADCHVTPSNYQAFECILCHQHSNKTEVDRKHSQVNGYQYTSTACYACHPRGD